MKQTLHLENLSCQNCVKHVTKHFMDLKGVTDVAIDLETGIAAVESTISHSIEDYQDSLKKTIYKVKKIV